MMVNRLLYTTPKSRIGIKNSKSATSLPLPDIRKKMDKQRIQTWPSYNVWRKDLKVWKATRETLFSMAYGTETVISVQVTTMPNLHTEELTALENAGILKADLIVRKNDENVLKFD